MSGLVNNSITLDYDILNLVDNSITLDYDILLPVDNDLTFLYDIFNFDLNMPNVLFTSRIKEDLNFISRIKEDEDVSI